MTVSISDQIRRGVLDVRQGVGAWQVWWMLACNDIGRRYRRSKIGQFWLTLSMGVMVLGMSVIYSTLFKQDFATFIPFIACGLVFWALISSVLNESCQAFIDNEAIMKQVALALFAYILRMLARNLVILAHNAIIVVIVIVLARVPQNLSVLMIVPGVALVLINLAWMGYVLAIVSARFRDIPQIVQSVVQILFFVSPVIYRPTMLGSNHPIIVYNPFAWMLEVMRDPLLGVWPPLWVYAVLVVMAMIGWTVALIFSGRYAQRVVYWL